MLCVCLYSGRGGSKQVVSVETLPCAKDIALWQTYPRSFFAIITRLALSSVIKPGLHVEILQ